LPDEDDEVIDSFIDDDAEMEEVLKEDED